MYCFILYFYHKYFMSFFRDIRYLKFFRYGRLVSHWVRWLVGRYLRGLVVRAATTLV